MNSLLFFSNPWNECRNWVSKENTNSAASGVFVGCVSIGQLRWRATKFLSQHLEYASETELTLLPILQEGHRIDQRLSKWSQDLEAGWKYRKVDDPIVEGQHYVVDYYQDIQAAKVWNQYRGASIFLHETLLECIEKRSDTTGWGAENNHLELDKFHNVSLGKITSILTDICASIPFHLVSVNETSYLHPHGLQSAAGGGSLIWPLEFVINCRYSSDGQLSQAKKAIEEIGQVLGIKRAPAEASAERSGEVKMPGGASHLKGYDARDSDLHDQ